MKKLFCLLLVLCLPALIMCGCGQKTGDRPSIRDNGQSGVSEGGVPQESSAGPQSQDPTPAQAASPFFLPEGLHDEGVEDYDLVSSFSIANRSEMIEKREKYSDDSGNLYLYAGSELVSYQMPDFGVMHENSEVLEKEDCLAAADEALSAMIRDYDDYSIMDCAESHGCYKLLMSSGKSELFYDSLTVMVGFDGVIRWLTADYCDLSEVSDEQVRAADELLEKYLADSDAKYVCYESSLRFRMRNGCLLATYNISFDDPDGFCYAEAVSFVL